MPAELYEAFKESLSRKSLWKAPESVLVAVSGGSDSVALLHLYARLRNESPFPLGAAHLNHAVRGSESDEDERFVAELARRLQVPLHTARLAPQALEGKGEGWEAAARKARYQFLREIAAQVGASRVAMGHTKDDQAETVLMRLLRGSGRRGLGGIHPAVEGVFIRPLLGFTKQELAGYLQERGEIWREDSSNRSRANLRSRIRHDLIPALRGEFNPDLVDTLARTAEVFREEDDYLASVTAEIARRLIRSESHSLSLGIPALRALPAALRRRLLRSFVEQAFSPGLPPPDFALTSILEALIEEARHGAAANLPGGLQARVLYADLVIARPMELPLEVVPLPIPGQASLPELGFRLCARRAPVSEVGDPRQVTSAERALLDADSLPGPLAVRHRRKGDLFRPLGAPGESKLKSYFIDHKVPRPARDRVPLVVSGDRIAWVVGFQIDERYKVTPQTRQVVILSRESR
ncbi:MAG TPA: tRNA lysidine(34) synthetase TilS [Candidatus Polarisedimenticolia bacterium]|nr:tRNA lysidine(34) synthetase TilS [Candidatus Polarisedimenticolia bacterium]